MVATQSTKPEDAFYLAVGYRFSAQSLWQKIESIVGPANVDGFLAEHFPPTALSALVLECLSIELYLERCWRRSAGGSWWRSSTCPSSSPSSGRGCRRAGCRPSSRPASGCTARLTR